MGAPQQAAQNWLHSIRIDSAVKSSPSAILRLQNRTRTAAHKPALGQGWGKLGL